MSTADGTNTAADDEKIEQIDMDDGFKKRIVFIRHGNSIWNKMKGQGTKSKISAVGQGVVEFVKSNYDGGSHKSSTVLDAPLSDIGIKQCKKLSLYLSKQQNTLQNDLTIQQNYVNSHNKCNNFINKSSVLINNIINNNNSTQSTDNDNDNILKLQEYINSAQNEMKSFINSFKLKINIDIQKLENLILIYNVLLTKTDDSIVVCSNLRRAISTSIISLWDRFHPNNPNNPSPNNSEKLYILPCLQEIGIGVDAQTIHNTDNNTSNTSKLNFVKKSKFVQSITGKNKNKNDNNTMNNDNNTTNTGAGASANDANKNYIKNRNKLTLSQFEQDCRQLNMLNNANSKINAQKMREFYDKRLKTVNINTKFYKQLDKNVDFQSRSESDKRSEIYMDWIFNDKSNENKKIFITVGHSHWFRAYFNKYLDKNVYNELKTNKINNCGVVAFDVYRNYHYANNKVNQYSILPESIITIYEAKESKTSTK